MKKNNTLNKIFSVIALSAVFAGNLGIASSVYAATDPATVKVTIEKYIDGQKATSASANSADFQMDAAWDATNIGAGTGQYTLGATGFGTDTTPYQAITADMTSGADYSTSEVINSVVSATCDTSTPFALVGYTTGDTLLEAEAATLTLVAPSFVGQTTDKFVIVWNKDCSVPATAKVVINKFINGAQATAITASSSDFQMNATWNSTSHGAGAGQYNLSANGSPAYEASTVDFNSGADYSTNEVLSGAVVGSDCAANKPFALVGYTTGNTFAEASAGTPTSTMPSFTNLMNNKSVIVWNKTCVASTTTATTTGGTIGGDVTGGQDVNGTLHVTSIDTVKGSATADGTFGNGLKYVFHITAPTNEQSLAMKFSDWLNTASTSSIAAANNIRISSLQANNAGATVLITAADTYSSPTLTMTSDLDLVTVGRQVDVTVEVAVPANSVNGSYTTNYGVKTL